METFVGASSPLSRTRTRIQHHKLQITNSPAWVTDSVRRRAAELQSKAYDGRHQHAETVISTSLSGHVCAGRCRRPASGPRRGLSPCSSCSCSSCLPKMRWQSCGIHMSPHWTCSSSCRLQVYQHWQLYWHSSGRRGRYSVSQTLCTFAIIMYMYPPGG